MTAISLCLEESIINSIIQLTCYSTYKKPALICQESSYPNKQMI